ncbi:5,6-dimethylbenzimidazole synthase [Methylobacterium adhaesivum]|uniref:5,6-dimethylbenzimidazole synthase n=1 Tax=Methylobacterium adhaesivum TaxID=333297 RepID=A0ABT8BI39_9HYPH|nr:5,6-dimethylbenzimidazole synthase [Methylobacterium adhaesivum]MDN3591784.1 5,6-dimethylbenzimidazole synthase [Methylobacterium adhaesivum]GJD32122.1 5,6-dimethylbenzimidazole synthase [Methylobacterium adhaesivum]
MTGRALLVGRQVLVQFDAGFRQILADLFAWRRDVRRFRDDLVDDALLRRCLDLAALSPSVGNSQPWRFVRVADQARRAEVTRSFERCNAAAAEGYTADRRDAYVRLKLAGLREAPVHLAVFCDEGAETGHGLGRATMPEMLRYSVVGAVQTFWLAARAHGLGVGWVSILEPETVCTVLDVPCTWHLVAYLCVGFPVEEHADPELVRHGWQARIAAAAALVER